MNKTILVVIDEEKLYIAMTRCLSNVLWKDSVAYFYINWPTEIAKLTDDISNKKYKKRKPYYFTIGKRIIMSISFRDRVLERAIHDFIICPAIQPTLIAGNCACQVGKGTEYAKDFFKKCIRKEWRKHGTQLYVLKCDIKGYYDNLQHSTGEHELKRVLEDYIFDFIKQNLLSVYEGECGYKAGTLIAQIIGVSALNSLDHYIKEKLRIKGYVRYVDDFELIHWDKEYLKYCKTKIEEYLETKGLQLNAKKTKIVNISEEPVEFLGFDFKLTSTGKVCAFISSHKAKRKMVELFRMAQKVKRGEKTRESADKSYMDYRAHVMYGDTHKFLNRLDTYYFGLYGEEVPDYVKNPKKFKREKRT